MTGDKLLSGVPDLCGRWSDLSYVCVLRARNRWVYKRLHIPAHGISCGDGNCLNLEQRAKITLQEMEKLRW